jgi:hypothetical protein
MATPWLLVALESAQHSSVHVCHFAGFGPTKQKLLNFELFSSFKIKNGLFSPLCPIVLRWVTDLPRGLIHLGTVTGIVLRWMMAQEV